MASWSNPPVSTASSREPWRVPTEPRRRNKAATYRYGRAAPAGRAPAAAGDPRLVPAKGLRRPSRPRAATPVRATPVRATPVRERPRRETKAGERLARGRARARTSAPDRVGDYGRQAARRRLILLAVGACGRHGRLSGSRRRPGAQPLASPTQPVVPSRGRPPEFRARCGLAVRGETLGVRDRALRRQAGEGVGGRRADRRQAVR